MSFYNAKQMKARGKQLAGLGMVDSRSVSGTRFYCDICKKDFGSASALIAHGQKAHGK